MKDLLRAILVLAVILVVGMFLFGFWAGSGWRQRPAGEPASVGTSGTVEKAREKGAELGEKAAVASVKIQNAIGEAELTTKIKAKMALDDLVKARAIDVTTNGTTVTLTGKVSSREEHDRAIALARETDGVTKVVDGLRISQ